METLIAFATRWGPQFGGINSFNQDLLEAFAIAFAPRIKTVCVVLTATDEHQREAEKSGTQLISLESSSQIGFSPDLEPKVWQALEENNIQCDGATVWLGHDRITGEIALEATKKRGGRSVILHHMSYDHYESFSETSAQAREKTNQQRQLFEQADIVLAIGPLLRDSLGDMLDRQSIPMLVPGLPEIPVKNVRNSFRGFISGRLSDDAKKIKQGHLGVAAFASAIKAADENTGLPNCLQGSNEPELTLRGVDFENSNSLDLTDAEHQLKVFAEGFAERAIRMHALPFTTNRKALFDDLRSSTVAMMPSWHEGFGLVAWEAIAAGVPLILSKKSGVYQLLEEFDVGLYLSCVNSIDIAGSINEPFFRDRDCVVLKDAIIAIAKSPQDAITKALRLREALLQKYTWADCARNLAKALDWYTEAQEIIILPQLSILEAQSKANSVVVQKSILEMPQPIWLPEAGLSNSRLLMAEEAVIPFDPDREPFLHEQYKWAVDSEYPVAIRLLTGVGGSGKTRLALELCNRLQAQGWQTGFLNNEIKTHEAINSFAASSAKVCLVVDYAETRQSQLLELTKQLLTKKDVLPEIRVLLLARDSGDWWSLLPSKDPQCEALLEGMATSGPFQLPQLHDDFNRRKAAYKLAIESFAQKLGVSKVIGEPDLEDDHFAHPLYIQMAAILALYGEQPKSAESVARALIGHERRYWAKSLATVPADETDAARLMTLATLSNGLLTVRDCEQLWVSSGGDKAVLKPLFNMLAQLYPGRQGVQGLRPDLLGEALVAQSLLGVNGSELLAAVLSSKSQALRHSSLTVLARMLRNREELALVLVRALTPHFVACADDLIAVIVETPSSLPKVVENVFGRLPKKQKIQAAGVLNKHIGQGIIPLIDLSVLVRHAQLEKLNFKQDQSPLDQQAEYALSLDRLSASLADQGNINEALKYSKDALVICERLAQIKSDRFEHERAIILHNYSLRLWEQGLFDECLTMVRLALVIYERLVRVTPQRFEGSLAIALNTCANTLGVQGFFDEAAVMAKQSLDIHERLAQTKSEKVESNLGMSLNNYAVRLDEQGRLDDALIYAKKALAIREKWALLRPERHERSLASSLNNCAVRLHMKGQTNDAIVMMKQALDIDTKLVLSKPERFRPGWAISLNNFANMLISEQGSIDRAVVMTKQALDVYENLALSNPKRFNNDFYATKMFYHLLEWLDSSEELKPFNKFITDNIQPRRQKVISFNWCFLNALASSAYDKLASVIAAAEIDWMNMDKSQKTENIQEMLLLAGLAEFKNISFSVEPAWREQLESFRKQRQGKMPWWMEEVARRSGFSL